MQALRGTVERVARTDLPVLILGESGTGKEVVARADALQQPAAAAAVHRRSTAPPSPRRCWRASCSATRKGPSPAPTRTRPGKFELADGGTLFLDEIGDISPGGQAKLLRVLEEKVVYRVGGIAADPGRYADHRRHQPQPGRGGPGRQVPRGPVLPPERRDARPAAVARPPRGHPAAGRAFPGAVLPRAGRQHAASCRADARQRLEQHDWPGNVRELRNLMERVAFLCPSDKVEAERPGVHPPPGAGDDADRFGGLPWPRRPTRSSASTSAGPSSAPAAT